MNGQEAPFDSTARIADNRPVRMFPAGSSDEESGMGATRGSHRLVGYMLHIPDQYYPLWMDRDAVRIDGRLDSDDIKLSNGRGGPYAWRHHIQSRVANQISADLCFARATTWRFFACQYPRQPGPIWGVTARKRRSLVACLRHSGGGPSQEPVIQLSTCGQASKRGRCCRAFPNRLAAGDAPSRFTT